MSRVSAGSFEPRTEPASTRCTQHQQALLSRSPGGIRVWWRMRAEPEAKPTSAAPAAGEFELEGAFQNQRSGTRVFVRLFRFCRLL